MKSRVEGGVVDKNLNVYGTQNLKIAGIFQSVFGLLMLDLSICPGNVGSNTYSTALMVGEKASTIIAMEL